MRVVMDSTACHRIEQRIHGPLFVILLLAAVGLLGYLSTQYRTSFDWTASGRHTLSSDTREMLSALSEPIEVTVFASTDEAVRRQIAATLQKYQDLSGQLRVAYVDPQLEPQCRILNGTGVMPLNLGRLQLTVAP